jgi:flagellar biosynthesis/type III secretory pathway chaperone
MTLSTNRTQFDGVLQRQMHCCDEMLAVLEREKSALLDNELDVLLEAGAEKNRLLDMLELLESERQQLAADPGYTDLKNDPRFEASWNALLVRLDACREKNRNNGALVTARQELLARTLSALQLSEPRTYDASGRAAQTSVARTFGRV